MHTMQTDDLNRTCHNLLANNWQIVGVGRTDDGKFWEVRFEEPKLNACSVCGCIASDDNGLSEEVGICEQCLAEDRHCRLGRHCWCGAIAAENRTSAVTGDPVCEQHWQEDDGLYNQYGGLKG